MCANSNFVSRLTIRNIWLFVNTFLREQLPISFRMMLKSIRILAKNTQCY